MNTIQTNQSAQEEIALLRQRVADLEHQAAHFREFVEGTSDLITQVDNTGVLRYANAAAERIFGLPLAECIGKSAFDFVHPDDRERTQHAFVGWLQNKEQHASFENRQVSIHGDVFPMLWSVSLHYDEQGNFLYANSICRDTSQLEELQHSQQRLQFVLEGSSDGAWDWNIAENTAYLSPRYKEMLGYHPDELSDSVESWTNLIHPQDMPGVQEHLNAYLEGRSDTYALEHRLQHKSGEWQWMLTRGKVVDRDEQGAPTRMTGTISDISQRKEQEEELRTFKMLVENARDAIAVTSLKDDGKLLYANPAYNTMLGYPESAIGSSFIDAYAETPERMQEIIQEATANGSWQGMLTYKRNDGSTLPAHLSGFILYDNNNQPYAAAGIIRDMTAQQRQEEELRTFKQVVENASDAIALVDAQTGNITYYNEAHRRLYRCGESQLGQSIGVIVAPEDQYQLPTILQEIMEQGIWRGQLQHIRYDNTIFPALESCFTIKDEHGNIMAMVGIVRDITDIVQAEAERATLQQQVIDAQQAALRELSTPLVPIADGVLAMPLVGTIDSGRAMMIMESLLEGVSAHQAEIAIVDITGVQIIDTQVANALISAARATKLLGAQVVLTGIQSQIAQTLVHLGVDLSDIVTRSTLQAGIAYAIGKK